MKKTGLPPFLALATVVFVIVVYEYHVYQWAKTDPTPIIRVDVFVIYPLVIVLGFLIYWLAKRWC